jgi:DNA-binding NarL/FixJ family response regulator
VARRLIRTLLAADSPQDRAGLRVLLSDAPPIEIVGTSATAELRRLIAQLAPDVLVEFGEHGSTPARLPRVSLVEDPPAAWAARVGERGPGDGFAILSRDAEADEVCGAVVAVAAGRAVAQRGALAVAAPQARAPHARPERLSAREVDVLSELARGAGNKQIAARLGVSEHTVKFHVGSIFAKLGVSSRTEAVTHGVRLGLIML